MVDLQAWIDAKPGFKGSCLGKSCTKLRGLALLRKISHGRQKGCLQIKLELNTGKDIFTRIELNSNSALSQQTAPYCRGRLCAYATVLWHRYGFNR